jgi:hypothetical protein
MQNRMRRAAATLLAGVLAAVVLAAGAAPSGAARCDSTKAVDGRIKEIPGAYQGEGQIGSFIQLVFPRSGDPAKVKFKFENVTQAAFDIKVDVEIGILAEVDGLEFRFVRKGKDITAAFDDGSKTFRDIGPGESTKGVKLVITRETGGPHFEVRIDGYHVDETDDACKDKFLVTNIVT